MDMGREVLPIVAHTPVLAGVCGTDPFRLMPQFLREVRDAGFADVQDFPTVGLIDGTFRAGRAGGCAVRPRAHEGVVGFFGASSMERLPPRLR